MDIISLVFFCFFVGLAQFSSPQFVHSVPSTFNGYQFIYGLVLICLISDLNALELLISLSIGAIICYQASIIGAALDFHELEGQKRYTELSPLPPGQRSTTSHLTQFIPIYILRVFAATNCYIFITQIQINKQLKYKST